LNIVIAFGKDQYGAFPVEDPVAFLKDLLILRQTLTAISYAVNWQHVDGRQQGPYIGLVKDIGAGEKVQPPGDEGSDQERIDQGILMIGHKEHCLVPGHILNAFEPDLFKIEVKSRPDVKLHHEIPE
jgi:hypothetical protein